MHDRDTGQPNAGLFHMSRKSLLRTAFIAAAFLTVGTLTSIRAQEPAEFDVRPVPVKTPPPSYPQDLKQSGVTGMVAVRVEIDEQGNVVECAISKSTHPGFEQAALDAIRGWKFKPASKAGAAVKSRLIVPIKFSEA